jgi:monoamine oxidase
LADILPPGSVHLSSPVIEVRQDKDRPRCFTQVASGRVFESKRVIVSTPRIAHRNIKFVPPLPHPIEALADRGISGFHARVVLEYSDPWWRERGLSGFMESLPSCGPVSLTRDTCTEGDKHYSLTCSIVGRSGREWSALPATERTERILDHIGEVFGSVEGEEPVPMPISISERQWLDGTVTVMPPVVPDSEPDDDVEKYVRKPLDNEAGNALEDPWPGNVHFAGTEMAEVWRGYMEGAVQSGMSGAKDVIGLLVREGGQAIRSSL